MAFAIVDFRMPDNIKNALENEGFSVLSMPPFLRLSEPVSSHPDMLMLLHGSTVYTYKEYRQIAKREFDILEKNGIQIICEDMTPSPDYPKDIAFNCFFLGDKAFGRADSLAPCVHKIADRLINVRQGYSACSTVVLDSSHIITEDKSIADAAEREGVSICLIDRGGVALSPYEYGFIGGASGVFGKTVYFTGSIEAHTCYERIKNFITEAGMRALSLSNALLYDFGKILFV